jgi:hypothetical protein
MNTVMTERVKAVAFELLNTEIADFADVAEYVYRERSDETRMKISRRSKSADMISHVEALRIIQYYQRIADRIYAQLDTI